MEKNNTGQIGFLKTTSNLFEFRDENFFSSWFIVLYIPAALH